MAKRSREDFDSVSELSDSEVSTKETASIRRGILKSSDDTISSKILHLEASEQREVMKCELPPHRQALSFSTFEDYDVHYQQEHMNRCVECRRNFPTCHFLNLHQQENHDPLVAVLRERGERTVSIDYSSPQTFGLC